MSESLRTMPMVQPGLLAVFHFTKRLSIFFMIESGIACAFISVITKIAIIIKAIHFICLVRMLVLV